MLWHITNDIAQILPYEVGTGVSIAGRVTGFRRQGGIAFGHIHDATSRIQFCFQKRILGDVLFKLWCDQVKIGVHIGISGMTWKSSTGEPTILVGARFGEAEHSALENLFSPDEDAMSMVTNFTGKFPHPLAGREHSFRLLQDNWRGFPDKLNGIVDPEAKLRLRYLDCAVNPEVRELFLGRTAIVAALRGFLTDHNFSEVETPVLAAQASGAMAKPFVTHHNALDADLFLRIAPETYLKRAVAAGLGPVFELGKQFRNEGIDPSHLQEFTSLEWYFPYADYMDNLTLFRKCLGHLAGPRNVPENWRKTLWAWSREAPVVSYRELFFRHTGQNPDTLTAKETDLMFKTLVRPNLTGAMFVTDYPAHLSPMAARKPGDSNTVEQWQFIVDGWELVKCYSELTDPVLQRKLLTEQALERVNGDEEAMDMEEDFLECMEYGMPPMSGLGLGIDRLICLLSGKETLRDVVLFPTLLRTHTK